MLDELERDVKAVRKARDALGDRAPQLGRGDGGTRGDRGDGGGRGAFRGGRGGAILGKRRRDEEEDESDGSEVDEEVKRIPMPKDTPPPVPKEVLDKWYQARRDRNRERYGNATESDTRQGTSANSMPLGANNRRGAHLEGLPQRPASAETQRPPPVQAQTVYEAKPIVRDLRKEAVSAFVPAAVRVKMEKLKGAGGLVEPEEADRLEKEGYLRTKMDVGAETDSRTVTMEEVDDEDG